MSILTLASIETHVEHRARILLRTPPDGSVWVWALDEAGALARPP